MVKIFIIVIITFFFTYGVARPIPKVTFDGYATSDFQFVKLLENAHGLGSGQIHRLQALGKIWGFIKYYHPMVREGKLNWDNELLTILPKVRESRTNKEFNDLVSSWIDKFDTVRSHFVVGKHLSESVGTDIKILADLTWFNDPVIDNRLRFKLANIKKESRLSGNYYVQLNESVGNPEFANEYSYKYMPFPTSEYRLLTLFRYWNIIQYYYPYRDLIQDKWKTILGEYIPKFDSATNALEYRVAVLSLISQIHDTHAAILGDSVINEYIGVNKASYGLAFIQKRATVVDIYNSKQVNCDRLQKGDIIRTINNISIRKLVKKRMETTSGSNYPSQLRNISKNLLRTNDTLISVKYSRDGRKFRDVLRCYPLKELTNVSSNPGYMLLSENIGYLFPGKLTNDYLTSILPTILNTRGLIIDFRCYPADNILYTLGSNLLPEARPFVKASVGSIEQPGQFSFTPNLLLGKKNGNFYKGKVVIIVNETTQSAAEFHTMGLKISPNAIIVGSTTAGADGDISMIPLPGGLLTTISGVGIYYPDGKETQRVGIVPDVVCLPTIKGLRSGKDELLLKAIGLIR